MLSLVLGASFLFAGQAAAACSRAQLGDWANQFITSAKGDGATFKKASGLKYTENYKDASVDSGVYSKAIKIAHTRVLIDSTACGVYVEVIAPDNQPGYQLATQVFFNDDGAANKVETVITSSDPNSNSWFYNGQRALQVIQKEEQAGQRKEVPEAQRSSRDHLKDVADAYFTIFGSSAGGAKRIPNFSKDCLRQEGGFPNQISCTLAVGQPTQAKGTSPSCGTTTLKPHPDIRGYIVDEVVGTVEVLAKFAGAPDSHDFRIENCEVVLVHAVTTTSGGAASGLLSGLQGLLGGASSGGSSGGSSGSGGLGGLFGGLLGGGSGSGGATPSGRPGSRLGGSA